MKNYIQRFQQGGGMQQAQAQDPLQVLAQLFMEQTGDEQQAMQMVQMFQESVAAQYGEEQIPSVAAEILQMIQQNPEEGMQALGQIIQGGAQTPAQVQMARQGARLKLLATKQFILPVFKKGGRVGKTKKSRKCACGCATKITKNKEGKTINVCACGCKNKAGLRKH